MPTIRALAFVFICSAAASGGLIWLLQPMWRHYALARPNVRSSHKVPTPQGGGIVVVAVTVVAVMLAAALMPTVTGSLSHLAFALAAVILLTAVGAVDDLYVIEIVPRLLLQAVAVAIVVAALPSDLRVTPFLPWWIERILLVIGSIWFVNLVNFMDGIDWITVSEVVPVTAGLALFGLMGALPSNATVVSLALCGAMIGFAPFNRPVARLFLGDVGSLPIGLLLAWLLILLAGNGHLAAALLLPLYYVADATITLLRRLMNRERATHAHRQHFYQRAFDQGGGIYRIVGSIFALNIVLVGLGAVTIKFESAAVGLVALVLGSTFVAALLWRLSDPAPVA